jgi:hypothetical protein
MTDDLLALRTRYPAFVITHVPGSPWRALPMWTLGDDLEADSPGELAELMDQMLEHAAAAAAAGDPRARLTPRQHGAWIRWPL